MMHVNHATPIDVCHQLAQAMLVAVLLLLSTRAHAQTSDTPLYLQEPFDRITLDAANNSAVIDVFPIQAIRSGVPDNFKNLNLTIRRLQDPADLLYAVDGKHIVKIERFQDLLVANAKRAIADNQINEAFRYIARMKEVAPNMAAMQATEEAFFFADTRDRFRKKQFDESLLSLDEVFKINPGRKGLPQALNSILSQIINIEFSAENYSSVLNKLDFAKRRYGSISQVLVEQWETKLQAKAQEQLTTAKNAFQKGDASAALIAIRRASETWPATAGVEELKDAILAKFPRVRVGVTQRYVAGEQTHSTAELLNWATRRSQPLLHRNVVQLENFTVEGGRYRSDLGQLKVASDGQSLALQLRPDLIASGHRLTHQLLLIANPAEPGFSPRWAEYVKNIYLNTSKIQVQLKRATLRPEALLPRTLLDGSVSDLMKDKFQIQETSDPKMITYQRTVNDQNSDVSELTETLFDDPTEACQALADGRLDIVDRIHAGDYDQLAANPNIQLVAYRLPTIHGLVFNDREPLLRNATFRRGLLYGIDRQSYIAQELASSKKTTASVLSGFAPIGRSANDPLGYAYNPRLKPRKYDPSLATVLMRLALRARKADVEPKNETSDEAVMKGPNALPPLTLAFPDSHVATSASLAIASNWRRLGIDVTLRPLAAGQGSPTDNEWDVLYIEAMVEEPLADLPELVLGHQILGRHGGLVWHAMRQLQDAKSLEDARNEFAKIHRLTFDHTPMLPLWQIIEHAAVRKGFQGLNDAPISFYQDVDEWRSVK